MKVKGLLNGYFIMLLLLVVSCWKYIDLNYFEINSNAEYMVLFLYLVTFSILIKSWLFKSEETKIDVYDRISELLFFSLIILVFYESMKTQLQLVFIVQIIILEIVVGFIIVKKRQWFISHSILKEEKRQSSKKLIILLSLIILAGFVIRVIFLGHLSLWGDEAQVYIASKNILKTGLPYLDSGYLYTRDIPHLYITSLFLLLLGKTEFALRFISVLAGTSLIPVIYFLTRKVSDERSAILTSLITAFHPWLIEYSRIARSYMMMILFVSLSFYFFLRFIEKNDKKDTLWFTIFGVLSSITHQTGQIVLFLFFPFIIEKFRNKNLLKGKRISNFLISLLPFIIILLAIIGFKYLASTSYYSFIEQSDDKVLANSWYELVLSYIPFKFIPQWNNFNFLFKPMPFLVPLVMIFLPVFILNKIYNRKSLILIITILVLIISIVFSEYKVDINRGILFLFPFLLVFSGTIFFVIRKRFIWLEKELSIIILLIFIGLILFIPSLKIVFANYGDPINPYHSFFEGFTYRQDHKTVYEFVNNNYKDSKDIIIVFGNPKYAPFYLKDDLKIDYFIWNGDNLDIDRNNVYLNNTILIDNLEKYKEIIKNKNVWIITSYSIGNFPRIAHINSDFKNYIKTLGTPIYQSEDPYARVYYLKGKK